jgi:hypothetical protein
VRRTVQGAAADAPQARLEAASPHQPRRRLVIGVAVDVIRGEDDAWARVAQNVDHQGKRPGRPSELPVRQAQRDPLVEPEGARGLLLLRGATFPGAPGCPLPIRQVDHTDSLALPRRERQRATAADLRIVRMGGEGKDVERLHVSAPSDSSPSGCPPPDECRRRRGR